MQDVLIIGSGISGMSCAIRCAEHGMHATLVSPLPSERAQSVMAAGGINAVTLEHEGGDSVVGHIEDTLRGGAWLGGKNAVAGLCEHAEDIVRYLEKIGTVFSVDENGRPLMRAFGGQTHKRTHYCGSSTGKQIVSALVMEARRYEAAGLIDRRLGQHFHSALIEDGVCYGALMFDEGSEQLAPTYADAVVMAVGGQNALFGKTTGSALCDGYAVGRLFAQGAVLKNLEFVQYHPTTLETSQKRMLVSEAARGEGGRLFYRKDGERVYFMEDKYGRNGNLMTRDVVSREIDACGHEVFLDVSFLGEQTIDQRLPEVRDLCQKYRGIDIAREPIPVAPSVHFFMGGLAVHLNHETSIRRLYAVGECASMYHGANRLGGNSLLAALYSGWVAADDMAQAASVTRRPNFGTTAWQEQRQLDAMRDTRSPYPVMYTRDMLADTMRTQLGIVRNADKLNAGIASIEHDLEIAKQLRYDPSVSTYTNYSITAILSLARAALSCALARKESRGAHFRSDYPQSSNEFCAPTLISYNDGNYEVRLDEGWTYES
ncbi:MAG: FAD-binding protein [Coriobacteriales bacterium]|nr:FAD-binding protein [Coriobacteriales bacterium]